MTLMSKKQIEEKYNSYEGIAKAFSYPGAECTEIYLCKLDGKEGLSHYEMIRRDAEREALFSSPNIEETKLAWSQDRGDLVPYKS